MERTTHDPDKCVSGIVTSVSHPAVILHVTVMCVFRELCVRLDTNAD
jgi:hypothetical protein